MEKIIIKRNLVNYLRDKRFLGILAILVISTFSLLLVSILLNKNFSLLILGSIIFTRIISSFIFFDDYKLSWSKASTKTGLMKILLAIISFMVYMPILYLRYHLIYYLLI